MMKISLTCIGWKVQAVGITAYCDTYAEAQAMGHRLFEKFGE